MHATFFGNDTQLILGGDFNASIGMRSDTVDRSILGPYGIAHCNKHGDSLLDHAATHDLCLVVSFFQLRLKTNRMQLLLTNYTTTGLCNSITSSQAKPWATGFTNAARTIHWKRSNQTTTP